MAKGKNLNPADAYRKAQRKKELKKNKTERAKARDFALVKKDTQDLEGEIEKLETGTELSATDNARLTSLKNELAKIMHKKEEYVKEHPEQRKLVYRPRKQEKGEEHTAPLLVEQKRNLFNKHGLPRHPERSIYYDPVMNPYGVPPPGMPYVEKPLAAGEADSGEDVGDEDEDIVMPDGPPPGAGSDEPENDSDDDIPMPDGPPPGNVSGPPRGLHLLRSDTDVMGPAAPAYGQAPPGLALPPFPLPPPPPHMPPTASSFILSQPPLPPGLNGGGYSVASGVVLPPLPPPGFFPRRIQSAAMIQDPLTSIPHQTYQSHHASQLPPGHPSLPPKPSSGIPGAVSGSSTHTSATISAEPELRDLKREATAFVPASLKRKKATGLPGPSKVNAAPSVNADSEVTLGTRPDLVGVLKSQLGTVSASPSNTQVPEKESKASITKEKDDYQKFVDEMSDLLGPPGSS